MQRMQRITGRFLTRTPNEADVEAMLKDFDDSKVMLEKVRLLSLWLAASSCLGICEHVGASQDMPYLALRLTLDRPTAPPTSPFVAVACDFPLVLCQSRA